jgi:hypothetical protein
MHSAHAHATVDGLGQFETLGRQQFFTCELGFNSGDCTVALTGANIYLSWLLSHVAACLGLSDVAAEFDQWIANTQARRAAADPGASHAGPDIYGRSRRMAAISRGFRRPWITATTQSGFSSGAYATRY